MKNGVYKEIEDIKKMIDNWEEFYLSQAKKGEDNSYLIEDFLEQIATHVPMYVQRFKTLEYITNEEHNNFLSYLNSKIHSFKNKIENEDFPDETTEETIDIVELYNQFTVHKDLIETHLKFKNDNHSEFIEQQKNKIYNIAIKLIPYLYKEYKNTESITLPCLKGNNQIWKYIKLCEEDIINLKNAERFIYDCIKNYPNYDALELFTLRSIIEEWENKNAE